ncbi:MAG TPA: hypothetical protein VHG51_03250 [Longimicrobiaceae bacterium]|nr:hypothetical protein [Longimicrobiaceae bacterium]
MYRTCIFCSAALGSNEAIEEFPVGRSIAFDAWKGRLWAVCPRCSRWNLAPIEERWEATEAAEKRFRDSRLRAQSENVGLAKLPDGTRLIRIGEALPGEMAAWRYGGQLVSRRYRFVLATVGMGALAGAVVFGAPALLAAAGVSVVGLHGLANVGSIVYNQRRARRVVHRFGAEDSPTGRPLELRRWQLNGARVEESGGEVELHLPNALESEPRTAADGRTVWSTRCLTVRGPAARTVLGRAMVDANASGASRRALDHALELLGGKGSAEEYLRSVAARQAALPLRRIPNYQRRLGARRALGRLRGETIPLEVQPVKSKLKRPESLALEMALHEESERRALEGELSALEAAWREAEEIAAIADALPHDPLDRLKGG